MTQKTRVCSSGTRYKFLGKLFEQRPSYRILGILMFMQLATNAALWAVSHSLGPQMEDSKSAGMKGGHETELNRVATVLEVAFVSHILPWH